MSLDDLVGAWRLQSFVFKDEDGNDFEPLGPTPKGAVVISADGYLVLNFMAAGRAPYAEPVVLGGTEAERSAAAASFASFGGPCRIEGDTVVVEVEHAFHPNWVGGTQVRRFKLDGDRLTLQPTGPITIARRMISGQASLRRFGS